jgi:hypothetical protein
MPRTPLTLLQAERLSQDFQHLKGQVFSNDYALAATIEAVAVAPYDDINKYIFVLAYREHSKPEEALKLYKGPLFDVLVLGKLVSDRVQVVYRDLASYLLENNIPFDMQEYGFGGSNAKWSKAPM